MVVDAVLDDPALRERVDPTGFVRLIAGLPAQARAAWKLGEAWEPPAGFRRPGRVVALGMGGSAIGAGGPRRRARGGRPRQFLTFSRLCLKSDSYHFILMADPFRILLGPEMFGQNADDDR